MPRIPRMLLREETAVYHTMSRTALDGFVLGDQEKDRFVDLIRFLSGTYFAEVLGYCVMGNHFHLVVRMRPGDECGDEEIEHRYRNYYGKKAKLLPAQIPFFREKWANLSQFLKDLKQRFACYYNDLHERKGYFWGGRFKSVIVQNGQTLINCLAYVDLNPLRAGLVSTPESYRWCSLGFHVQTGNRGGWLSADFGLDGSPKQSHAERLGQYREFVYEKGGLTPDGSAPRDLSKPDLFRYRTRHFTDSAIIGTKAFVTDCWQRLRKPCSQQRQQEALEIDGLPGCYSMNRFARIAKQNA